MENVSIDHPSSWVSYRPSLCDGCWAGCCTLPLEITAQDLVRLGLATPDEVSGSLKKLARRLERENRISSFRARTGLFMLAQKNNGDCQFLGENRLCQVYERRPDVCRKFPEIGPRPGYCPKQKKQ